MASTLTMTFVDNSAERSAFAVPIADIDATNHDTQMAAVAALQGDVELCSLAPLAKRTVTHSSVDYPFTVPTNAYANRETAVVFTMVGDTEPSNKVRVSLPAPDLDKFPFIAAQSDIVNAPFSGLHADLASLIVELENTVKHPVTGEDMSVSRLEKIGRNL